METEIRYENEKQFYDGIKALTERGLTFEVYIQGLRIVLTGGY